ncbi:MAG: DEAD/DEAH box helicase family protein [Rhodocyclaceae bacterium]|nr:DEAD/DEAH box helicase family protein [Rhodocyclaceae bacterium]
MNNFRFRLRAEPVLEPKYKAFPYQEEATEFVATREYAAIFHEQGLGKTKIAIDVMLRWLQTQEVDTILVFTKKGLIANWIREFKAHSQLTPLVLSENSTKNYNVFTTPTRLVLSHFEAAKKEQRRFIAWLSSRRVAVIIDESAKIKNPEAALTKAFFELAPLFKKRVIMTGTPVANRPYDLWAQIFFLDGGASLGTDFKEFKETDLTAELQHDKSF